MSVNRHARNALNSTADPVKLTRFKGGDPFTASYSIEIGDDWAVSATVTVKEVPGSGLRINLDTMAHPELSSRLESLYIAKITSRALTDHQRWTARSQIAK